MKLTIDLENQVVGENLMKYIKDTIDNVAILTQVDCKIEIVGYETRPDTVKDIEILQMVDIAYDQIAHTINKEVSNENPDHPTPYKC